MCEISSLVSSVLVHLYALTKVLSQILGPFSPGTLGRRIQGGFLPVCTCHAITIGRLTYSINQSIVFLRVV